jgi:hypothetical protein
MQHGQQVQIQVKASRQTDSSPQDDKQVSDSKSVELKSADKETGPLDRLKNRVFQPLQKRLYAPLNRLVDKLGYISSALLLLAITGTSALVIRLWNNPNEGRAAINVTRFYFDARKSLPPRDANTAETIRDLTNRLQDYILPSNRSGQGGYSKWVAAQMTVSLQGKEAFDVQDMAQWLNYGTENCDCWRGNDTDKYGHLGATGWIMLAFARMTVRPTEKEVEFVLSNQHRPGWWAAYPSTDDPVNASTFPTAYCTWALAELLRRDLISARQKQRVAESVRKGRNWLVENSVPGKPGRWKDYPNGGYGTESVGASGLVLHVLHRTPGPSPTFNDRDWMSNLPRELPQPREEVSSGQSVRLIDGTWREDATHHFAFPWLVIATVDAYGEGTLSQKAEAARLFHQIAEKNQVIVRETKDMPWLSAETLIALRYLRGDDVI